MSFCGYILLHLGVESLGHEKTICLTLLHILPTLGTVSFLNVNCSGEYEVVSHCDFNVH